MGSLPFLKYEACGNDFIFILSKDLPTALKASELLSYIPQWCHRNTGIGADGVVFLDEAQGSISIVNSDGSLAETCGNALRCCGLHLLRSHLWDGTSPYPISTLPLFLPQKSGNVFPLATLVQGDLPSSFVHVLFGSLKEVRSIPLQEVCLEPVPFFSHAPRDFPLESLSSVFVQLENPHLVFMSPYFSQFSSEQMAIFGKWAQLSCPGNTPLSNIGLLACDPSSPMELEKYLPLSVYERGAGLTLCCGSGAVAAAHAWAFHHQNGPETPLNFAMPGGVVSVLPAFLDKQPGERVLVGPSRFVFAGVLSWPILNAQSAPHKLL